jgi:hypothetical protein
MNRARGMDVLCPSQSGHAVRHVANKCDLSLSAFTASGGQESWHADLRRELERKKKWTKKNP